MMQAEAIRIAQKHFNTSKVNAEQVRWGLENLNITEARLEELGMKGMGYPIKLHVKIIVATIQHGYLNGMEKSLSQ